MGCGTAANLYGVLHGLGRGGVINGHVLNAEVRLADVVGAVAVEIAVGLDAARILLGAGERCRPAAVAVGECAGVALCEVKHVVVAVYGQQVAHIYRSAEELDGVVGSVGYADVAYRRAAAHGVERESVVLDVGGVAGARVENAHVGERAAVVGCVGAAVAVVVVDLCEALGAVGGAGDGGSAVDDQSAPVAPGGRGVVGGEGYGSLCRALGENLSAALDEQVAAEALARLDGHAGGNGEPAAVGHHDGAVDVVLHGGVEREVAGDERGQVLLFLDGCLAASGELIAGPAEDAGGAACASALDSDAVILAVGLHLAVADVGGGHGEAYLGGTAGAALAIGQVDDVLNLAAAHDEGVGDVGCGTAANLYGVLHGLGRGGVINGHVLNAEVRLADVVGAVAVEIAVGLDAARILLGAGERCRPAAVAVGECAGVALCEVKHVVVAVYGQQVAHIYRSAEELDGVVGSVGYADVAYRRAAAHGVERESVVLDVGGVAGAGVVQLHVAEHSAVVGCVGATVAVVVVDLGEALGTGGGS